VIANQIEIPFVMTDTTVTFNNQVWLRCNLNVSKFRNGDTIPEANNSEEFLAAGKAGKPICCYWEFKERNGEYHGKLYNWYCISDPRGLAPEGWHVADKKDWIDLEKNIQGDTDNKKLRRINHVGKGSILGGYINETGSFKERVQTDMIRELFKKYFNRGIEFRFFSEDEATAPPTAVVEYRIPKLSLLYMELLWRKKRIFQLRRYFKRCFI